MDIRIDFMQNSAGGNSTYIRGIPVSGLGTPEIRLLSNRKPEMIQPMKFICDSRSISVRTYIYVLNKKGGNTHGELINRGWGSK